MGLVEIIAPRSNTDELITCIQDFGSLQIEEVPLVVPGARSFLHRDQLRSEQEKQQDKLREVLRIVSEMEPLFKKVPLPEKEACEELRREIPREDADYMLLRVSRLKRKADSLWRKRHNIAHDLKSLERYHRRLDQLSAIREQCSFAESMKHLAVLVAPDEHSKLRDLESRMANLTSDNYRILYSEQGSKRSTDVDIVVLAYPEEYTHEVRHAVRTIGLAELRLPQEARELPLMEAVKVLEVHREELPEMLKKIEEQIGQFKVESRAEITVIDQICADALARIDCIGNMAHSTLLSVIHAWMPSDHVGDFKLFLQKHLGGDMCVTELRSTPVSHDQIPVRLKNVPVVKPFERLLKVFSDPLYGTVDPTPIMAVTFPLFFGLILGDIAYGLIILCGALWARRRWKQNMLARDITSVAVWCAAASMLFGIIFGEFLGDLGTRTGVIPIRIGGLSVIPLWQSREHIITELLVVTIALGFAHIVLGLLLGIFEAIRAKSIRHAWGKLALLLGLFGVILFAVPLIMQIDLPWLGAATWKGIAVSMVAVSVVILIVSTGPLGPVEIISLVANILSYSRLMALGVAGMVIANIANSMAATQASYFLGILVAIPIHFLAVALGVLEPTVHSLRLHYVEFLPKFFASNGRSYTPLKRKGAVDNG